MTPRTLKKPAKNRDLILQIAREFIIKDQKKMGVPQRRFNRAAVEWMERILVNEQRPKSRMKFWESYWRKELQRILDDKFKPQTPRPSDP
ncbi:MAG: hypothetical protein WCI73_03760 [Phycisphaerae bacterium]